MFFIKINIEFFNIFKNVKILYHQKIFQKTWNKINLIFIWIILNITTRMI